jgi:Ca2+-binding RTX toxin-like protein
MTLTSNFEYTVSGTGIGSEITSGHFASGFEHRGQEYFLETGSVPEVLDRLDLPFLRYPGGTQTENLFDLSNPNEDKSTALVNNEGNMVDVVPMNQFLGYCQENGTQAVIVLSTWRYFDEETRQIRATVEVIENGVTVDKPVEDVVKDFVRTALAIGDEPLITAFEIGNEWFNRDMFNWTASEFGALQAQFAIWIQEALDELIADGDLSAEQEPSIWVQSRGNGSNNIDGSVSEDPNDPNAAQDNRELLAELEKNNGVALEAADGVVDHFYQPVRAHDPLDPLNANWVASNRIADLEDDGWNLTGENALDIITTEWNVRGEGAKDGEELFITGFERLPIFLGHFADMVASGVDFAAMWTTQALGDGEGSLSEHKDTTLTPVGLLFRMMMPLVGSQLIDPNGDGDLNRDEYAFVADGETDANYYSFTFARDGKITVFFASGVAEDLAINADFSALINQGYHVHGTVLGVAPGNTALHTDADGALTALSYADLDGAVAGDGILNLNIDGYELLRLEFTLNEGVHLIGDDHNFDAALAGIDDTLVGSMWGDLLIGNDGDDHLIGHDGDDQLRGGTGEDTLDGGAGADSLYGNMGDDILFGGAGADILFGGAGADRLKGGKGTDRASYTDATSGLTVDLMSETNNTGIAVGDRFFSVENLKGSYHSDDLRGDDRSNTIWGASGNDQIYGRAGDDVLNGDKGDDTLFGGAGADILKGGRGTDLVSYTDSTDGLTVDLQFVHLNTGIANGDTFVNIENLKGSYNDDILKGDGDDNTIWGANGADVIYGRGGNDVLNGNKGDDTMYGGAGADHFNGGDGIDIVSYTDASAGLTVDMQDTSKNTGIAVGDTFINVENLKGSQHDDTLKGDGQNNTIYGAQGNDTIKAGGGDDIVYGGRGNDQLGGNKGNDILTGGDGDDSFVFVNNFGTDIITDFQANSDADVIDVSGMNGIADFNDLISNHITQLGADTVISDLQGNTVTLQGITAADLTQSDFVF